MPASTDAKIEELCARIRNLCRGRYAPDVESQLRTLAQELRVTIEQHLQMAKRSLSTKQLVIIHREQDHQGNESVSGELTERMSKAGD